MNDLIWVSIQVGSRAVLETSTGLEALSASVAVVDEALSQKPRGSSQLWKAILEDAPRCDLGGLKGRFGIRRRKPL